MIYKIFMTHVFSLAKWESASMCRLSHGKWDLRQQNKYEEKGAPILELETLMYSNK